ncbi:hypothetical protein V5735_19165 [Haladaptatus sp. SPP-AMP-3]|uniref:hypothetical protein n=1 Tax=Haladaptatus sp. SPP-AMP-3 TaxID=3121295 RepID=UPI003C2B133A
MNAVDSIRSYLPTGAEIHIPVEPFKQIGDMEYTDLQLLGKDINRTLEDEDNWEDHEDPYVRLQLTGQMTDAWGETILVDEEYDVWDLTSGEQGYVSFESDEGFTREQIPLSFVVSMSHLQNWLKKNDGT